MKKILKMPILLLCLMLSLSIGFLMFFIPLNKQSKDSLADIVYFSGETIYLVGSQGYSPEHYFSDSQDASTLNNVSTQSGNYINEKGEETSSYYIIKSNENSNNGYSTGKVVYRIPEGLLGLVEKGILYVKASIGVESFESGQNDKIQISLKESGNESPQEKTCVQTSDKEWLSTEFLKIKNDAKALEFSFASLAETSKDDKSKFSLYEPKLVFKVVLDKTIFENEQTVVNPGEVFTLGATNDVLSTSGNEEYLRYCRNIFRVEYNLVKGGEYAHISDGKLLVSNSAPNGTEITVSAKSRKDSLEGGYTDEITKTFTVNANQYKIQIQTDFKDPATFVGNGIFNLGKKIALRATPKENYVFKGWIINNEEIDTQTVYYTVSETNDIKCLFVRKINKIEIKNVDKVYDGTTKTDYEIYLEGLEDGHDLSVSGIEVEYVNPNAGTNRELKVTGSPVLVGEDVNLYELSARTITLPKGKISKKQIIVTTKEFTKIYGESDPKFTYTTNEENVSLQGELSRQAGETVGEYEITSGNLSEKNPNYSIELVKNYLKITERELSLEIQPAEKIYDGTKDVNIDYLVKNVINNDDVQVSLSVEFESKNVGKQKIIFKKLELTGEGRDNYTISAPEIYGTILKRDMEVVALPATSVYGYAEADIEYTTEGLLDGDLLEGKLSRLEGKDVGAYPIVLHTLNNSNYNIKLISNTYTITQRSVRVFANYIEKTYGDYDPIISYECVDSFTNEQITETLAGNLSRVSGEEVGKYKITQGSIRNENNPNYKIVFTSNSFSIVKREAQIQVNVLNKVYDGTDKAECSYKILNLAPNDAQNITVLLKLKFENAFAGENKKAEIVDKLIMGKKQRNYTFSMSEDFSASILKREVLLNVEDQTKIYGESDKEIKYSLENIIESDEFSITLKREIGESVGLYNINIESYSNSNYEVIYENVAKLNILPATIIVQASNHNKFFGDDDPDFQFEISDETPLIYDDKKEDVFEGRLKRKEGEIPGAYSILQGDLKANKNYKVQFSEGVFTINKKNVTVTVLDQEKIYGEDDPVFRFEEEGTVEGFPIKLKLEREDGEDVGSYKISSTNLDNLRYNISLVSGTLSISPRQIVLQADSKFKLYGNSDPVLSASVVDGDLQFNDDFEQLLQGKMVRELGETIGEYKIAKGTISIGANYDISFVNGTLTILPQEIEVKADPITKFYGDSDPEFTFKITKGSLGFTDSFNGELERVQGESVGSYEILIGTLALDENYIINYVPNTLTIERRKIKIIADAKTKIYGEDDPELTYQIEGGFVEGDVFDGSLERDKPVAENNENLFEMTGRYLISSTLSNPKYDIEFVSNYLTIKQREIFVEADYKSKIYGEEDPELTYRVTSGDIFDGTEFSGNIYRTEGNDAGKYDIRSGLTLGRNYKIIFTKGTFEILPIKLKVKTNDYEKTYGESDPSIEYEIIEGQLINQDVLLGGISKEGGEDVGKHRLISAFNNTNYEIELTENYLTINKKKAYLNVGIQDKVYNGNNVAYIKTPVVTGLIDKGVSISYDRENSARFETSEVGNGINVELYNIVLTGAKADNYELVLPENVTGNITNSIVENKTCKVAVATESNTDLKDGIKLQASSEDIDVSDVASSSKQVVATYNIWLENGEEIRSLKNSITVKFELPVAYNNRSNYYVYGQNKDGERVLLTSVKNGKYLEVKTDYLGEFVVLSDNELWIDICVYISFAVLAGLGVWLGVYLVKKAKKQNNKKPN